MPDSDNSALEGLIAQRAEILVNLSKLDGSLVRQLELLDELIAIRRLQGNSAVTDFSWVRKPAQAVELCLLESGPLSKREILSRLKEGGYITSNAEKWTVNTTINVQVDKGRLIREGSEKNMDALISLP